MTVTRIVIRKCNMWLNKLPWQRCARIALALTHTRRRTDRRRELGRCAEVTHSPEADIAAFHIPPTVTMSCWLFPSKAVESLLLCVLSSTMEFHSVVRSSGSSNMRSVWSLADWMLFFFSFFSGGSESVVGTRQETGVSVSSFTHPPAWVEFSWVSELCIYIFICIYVCMHVLLYICVCVGGWAGLPS